MTTVLLNAQPPADMPIWARLRLIARDVPFASITEWRFEDRRCISAFTVHGGWLILVRPGT